MCVRARNTATYTEHNSFQSILRLTHQPPGGLRDRKDFNFPETNFRVNTDMVSILPVTFTGCLTASITVMRDVSLTRDGFPRRASMYLPATPVAFLAE